MEQASLHVALTSAASSATEIAALINAAVRVASDVVKVVAA